MATATTSNIEELFKSLDIKLVKVGRRLTGVCPIHNGDNTTAFSYYLDKNIWYCFTNKCHEKYGNKLDGLISGALSISRTEANKVLKDKLGHIPREVKPICEQDKFVDAISRFSKRDKIQPTFHNKRREDVRKWLNIPAEYYINRGYSAEILDRYDVGLPITESQSLRDRVIVPIYDSNGYCIGLSGRSFFDKCRACDNFHKVGMPCETNPKWKHTYNLDTLGHLYNHYSAAKYIKKCKTAILVESPGNVWRLEEAGFHIGLATFGTTITYTHYEKLQELNVKRVINLADLDNAGTIYEERLKELAGKTIEITTPQMLKNDVGEMDIIEVQNMLVGLI
jgi:DNA primase